MAKLLTKSYVISSCHQDQRPQHHGFSRSCRNRSSRLSLPAKSLPSLKVKSQFLRSYPLASSFSSGSEIHGKRLVLQQSKGIAHKGHSSFRSSVAAQMTLGIGKTQKWWEKGLQPNMREVNSAQDLVDSLLHAGDKLVVVDFFSPGCGGCRALHPKICQLAEMSPDVQFLQVNYEEHKSMCYSLGVHVLPFFRFYRGAQGRVCSFSCTNATIKKFKDALAKHTPDRCSLGPAKGLEEKELLALSANKDLGFTYTPKQVEPSVVPAKEPAASSNPEPLPLPAISLNPTEEKTLIAAGRG